MPRRNTFDALQQIFLLRRDDVGCSAHGGYPSSLFYLRFEAGNVHSFGQRRGEDGGW